VKWPARWDTTTEVRHVNADGSVVKVTIEQEVTITGEDDSGTIGQARRAAMLAAVEAFKTTDLPALITDDAPYRGTDPDTRMWISVDTALRKS
jgi:hypothetical protein